LTFLYAYFDQNKQVIVKFSVVFRLIFYFIFFFIFIQGLIRGPVCKEDKEMGFE